MFDIGASELLVVGVVALVVIGPKELPGVLRSVGRTVGKIRTMAGEFQAQFSDALREAEMEETRKKVSELGDSVKNAFEAEPTASSSASRTSSQASDGEIHAAATPDLAPPLPEPAHVSPETLAAELAAPQSSEPVTPPAAATPQEIAAATPAHESAPPKAAGHSGS